MNIRMREDYRSLTGPEKAAILMLSLSEEQAAKIFENMDDDEILELSQVMASLGKVSPNVVERLFVIQALDFLDGFQQALLILVAGRLGSLQATRQE